MKKSNSLHSKRTSLAAWFSSLRPATLVSTLGNTLRSTTPGVTLCLVMGVLCVVFNRFVPQVSALLVAILLGIAVANLVRLPKVVMPGVAVSAKKLLRIGIVLLGFSIVFGDIVALGWGVVAVVVVVVFGGAFGTMLIGRWMGVPRSQSILIGSGFSVCGAAAVAGVESSIRRKDSEVVTAIGLVVIYGTLMIGLVPLAMRAAGVNPHLAGLITGASIHEVAQVVAAGGILGPSVLKVAVIVKLARVLMLAPLIAVFGLLERRQTRIATKATSVADSGDGATAATNADVAAPGGKRAPIIPLFVVGFIAAAVFATFVSIPSGVSQTIKMVQTVCLGAAMFALGLGINIASFKQVGLKPVALGATSTVWVVALSTVGMILVG